jgi:iron-sulfur cluster repair protein YtfE (RIC family)
MRIQVTEHDDHAEYLARMCALTGGLLPPPHAPTETAPMDHIHLERSILFAWATR